MFTVSCPNCGATYQLDEAKVGPNGRKLKCAKCAHVWVAMKESASPEPAATSEEVVQPVQEEVKDTAVPVVEAPSVEEHAPAAVGDMPVLKEEETFHPVEDIAGVARQGGWRWFLGGKKWIVLGTLVAAAGLSAGLWVLMSPAPKDADVDMDAPVVTTPEVMKREVVKAPAGVVIEDVSSGFSTGERDELVFSVKGVLDNTGKDKVTLPELQVELVNAEGGVADVWPVKLDKGTLAAGEKVPWEVHFSHPPVDEMTGWRAQFVK